MRLHGSALGIFSTRVLCSCSAWEDEKMIPIFLPFCLTFVTGVKLIAVFFMKRAKKSPNN